MFKKRYFMKKNILLLPALAAISIAFTGCNEDQLDIPQKGIIAYEDFYKTDDDAEAALAKVYIDSQKNFVFLPDVNGYNYGPYFALTNFQADDIYFSGSGPDDCVAEREFHDFVYDYDNCVVKGGYTMLYRSIHKCNLVLDNFSKIENPSTVMKRCMAEARVMRAFDHLLLAIYWGNPPIVDHVLSGADRPANSESQNFVLDWVVNEIDAALGDLKERESVNDQEGTYHVTKGFANAVKGKALIWAGKYQEAKAPLKEVITSGKYALLPGTEMKKIMHADGKGSSESVMEFNYVETSATLGWESALRNNCNAHMTFMWRTEFFYPCADERLNWNGWGWLNPTGAFAKDLIDNDGIDSYRRKAWIITYDELLSDFKWANDAEKGLQAGKEWHGCEGYFCYKNIVHPDQGDLTVGGDRRQNRNFPIMRYAEILLLYAEACAQTGDNDGLKYLNEIQQRAGSKHISSSLTLEEVQQEKQYELWLEGTRSVDLIRWGKTQTLKDVDKYAPAWSKDGLVENGQVAADYYKKYYGDRLGFKQGKDEFLPYPKVEMDLNTNLVQNPGW